VRIFNAALLEKVDCREPRQPAGEPPALPNQKYALAPHHSIAGFAL
jgi:hypothetical protein